MTILLGLHTTQIDYTSAFMQATLEEDVFVEMPPGFEQEGKVWKLTRAIYCLKQSSCAFFEFSKQKLIKLGFHQSIADPCLFISPTVVCLIYVDNAIFVYKSEDEVDKLTEKMAALDILFEVEDDVAGYLGVHIERNPEKGTITLSQKGLIQRIIEAMHLDGDSVTSTVPVKSFLPLDKDGEPPTELYSYASVAGMLQYLQLTTRPDISFAVSQVCRYIYSPKRSHEKAMERIGLYLKETCEGGLMFRPKQTASNKFCNIDVYVDADFASGWGTEEGTNPDSVKS